MPERPPPGINMDDLDSVTLEEADANLIWQWRDRRPLYNMYAPMLMIDHAPDFWKRQRLTLQAMRTQPDGRVGVVLLAVENMHSYMMYGWETGIKNESDNLRRNGATLSQVMEIVMFAQNWAGMRGLGHTFHALKDMIPVWADPPALPSDYDALVWPDGWAADPEAFRCGLDMSTPTCTDQDRQRLAEWYESTIGYFPKSVQWGLKHNADWVKANRAKWEVAIKTLPKQVAPLMMLRHNCVVENREGLREAALLAKAWGFTPELIARSVIVTANYFTGFEGLHVAEEALDGVI